MNVLKYKRGQVWWYKTGDNFNGSIIGKSRPVIIMSNELANKNSTCLLGIPCTTQEKKNMPTHTSFILNGNVTTALAENMLAINKEKLTEYIGTVDDDLLVQLEYNVIIALGLEHYMNIPSLTNTIPIEMQMKNLVVSGESIQVESTSDELSDTISSDKQIKIKKAPVRMSKEEKQRFLNDYTNHDKDYMLKKYNIKDNKALLQKVYLIRKEFGLGVRNK